MAKVIGAELENEVKVEKKKKTWLWLLLAVVLVIALGVGYFLYSDLRQEELLKDEIEAYMELDFVKDDYTVDVKTKGDYALVEKAIKTYFKEMSDIVKEVSKLENDDEFINILTPDNFKKDGPNFANTLKKIADVRSSIQENIDKFATMCSEEYMLSLIEKYEDLDSYYVDLYKDLMYTNDDLKEIQDTKNEMIELKDNFNVFLDDCESIILFLKNNNGKWMVQGNSIVFDSDALLEKYNLLTSKLLENSEI